jgi:hypothetical protein
MKTTSRFAIAAAAGVLLGGIALSPAQAADLGGACCADLEERVAELEATTARKGNRKVSLTITGQVGAALLFWDDDFYDESDVYVVGNNNGRSLFRFLGSAAIDPDVSAGFILEIDTQLTRSNKVDQADFSSDGDDGNASDLFGISDAAVWIESKRLGRVTLGKFDSSLLGITGINLGNHGVVADPGLEDYIADFYVTGPAPAWGQVFAGELDGVNSEPELIRYDSPTWHGFTLSTYWGEDDQWGGAIRYAKEFNSIRVAAGIGWEEGEDDDRGSEQSFEDVSFIEWELVAGSASILHVPSGLFLFYSAASLEAEDTGGGDVEIYRWYVSGGINKKWNSLGATVLYAEYGEFDTEEDGIEADGDVFGFGFVQNVDNAALQLYAGFRSYSGNQEEEELDDLSTIIAGALIKF